MEHLLDGGCTDDGAIGNPRLRLSIIVDKKERIIADVSAIVMAGPRELSR